MSVELIFQAEGLLPPGPRPGIRRPLDLSLRAGQGALVVVRDLDSLRRLMKCCLGLEKPGGGRLGWWGESEPGWAGSWQLYDFFRLIGYVDRQSQLLGGLTLWEHFELFSRYARLADQAEDESLRLCRLFGLESYLNERADDLPEPQRRLALYALAFCRRPRLMLMERPAQFLDRDFNLVWRLVQKRAAEDGLAYIVFERGENVYAAEYFDQVAVLSR